MPDYGFWFALIGATITGAVWVGTLQASIGNHTDRLDRQANAMLGIRESQATEVQDRMIIKEQLGRIEGKLEILIDQRK